MKYQLDPHFETLILVLSSEWTKETKKEIIKAFDEIGINGVAFYKLHLPVVERYYAAFQSKYDDVKGAMDFSDISDEAFLTLINVFTDHPQWLKSIKGLSDLKALKAIRKSILEFFEEEAEDTGQDIVALLETSEFSDKAKWQIVALLQQPKQRLTHIAEAVQKNLAAFKYAHLELELEINALIKEMEARLENDSPESLLRLPDKFSPSAKIIPTLAMPCAIAVADDICLCGLLIPKIFTADSNELTKSEAIFAAKALADSSKLEILLALKDKSLYNLEIAQLLNITPATTSHHMGMLLGARFVDATKKDGKMYYSLAPDGLKRFADWITGNFKT